MPTVRIWLIGGETDANALMTELQSSTGTCKKSSISAAGTWTTQIPSSYRDRGTSILAERVREIASGAAELLHADVDFIDEFSFGELRSRETLMPRIIDRSSGRELGRLSELEYGQLMSLFEESWDDELPAPIDPDAIERLAESGASPRLMAVVMQILQGGEDFDVGWEPD